MQFVDEGLATGQIGWVVLRCDQTSCESSCSFIWHFFLLSCGIPVFWLHTKQLCCLLCVDLLVILLVCLGSGKVMQIWISDLTHLWGIIFPPLAHRLKAHYASYEPVLKQLSEKYQNSLTQKMLTSLERDKAMGQVKLWWTPLAQL